MLSIKSNFSIKRKQIHQNTLREQLKLWADIVHFYFSQQKVNESSISELDMDTFELFTDNSTKIPSSCLII